MASASSSLCPLATQVSDAIMVIVSVVVAPLLIQSQQLLTVNAGLWLQRALASLLLQNHSKWIAVVVDDASDDNTTSQIAAAAAAADSRIVYWRNEQRMGALANTVAGSF